jgi:molybdate-binding protein/DNA-binding XRE family transcriptional regulator
LRQPLLSRLADARREARLSQVELAARAGVSRQTIATIEAGASEPGVGLALSLAGVLGRRVEDLFALDERQEPVLADGPSGASGRVALAEIGGRVVAKPLVGEHLLTPALAPADGVAVPGPRPGVLTVRPLAPPGTWRKTAVVLGCDPALSLLGRHVGGAGRVAWWPSGSGAALEALRRGEAHVAGIHLKDPDTGEQNLPAVRRLLDRAALVLAFAEWEQGLIVAPGSPLGLREWADLGRPGVRIVNRERGAGARLALEMGLARAGIAPHEVDGYEREVHDHLAVAAAVRSGGADVGVGARAAAQAYGLEFVPLVRERYDLVVPREHLGHPGVAALLEALARPSLRLEVEALGGYDPSGMGSVVGEIGHA